MPRIGRSADEDYPEPDPRIPNPAPPALDPLEDLSVRVRTVGIEPVPEGVTTASLTARLDSLTAEACSLKWITNPITCTALRTLLVAQPPGLVAFKTGLIAGRKTGKVADNAFWLLSVNADYIIARSLTLPAGGARRSHAHTDLR